MLILMASPILYVSAAEYEVDGEIDQTAFKIDGSIREVHKGTFTVFVDGCSWLIQITNQDGNGNPYNWSELACTNGGVVNDNHFFPLATIIICQ
jgi:hypothetical protein